MNAHVCNSLCEAGVVPCPVQPEGEGPDEAFDYYEEIDADVEAEALALAAVEVEAYERRHSKYHPVPGCRCAACDDWEDQ